jgi:hypothetical protein
MHNACMHVCGCQLPMELEHAKASRLTRAICTCSAIDDMLQALGPRLQQLTIGYGINFQKDPTSARPRIPLRHQSSGTVCSWRS